jgi:hypothetical protein
MPIPVQSCSLSTSRAGSVVWITFVNRSTVVANTVYIDVKLSSGEVFGVVDQGIFSPDAEVEHAFRLPGGKLLTSDRAVSCGVSYARFEGSPAAPGTGEPLR